MDIKVETVDSANTDKIKSITIDKKPDISYEILIYIAKQIFVLIGFVYVDEPVYDFSLEYFQYCIANIMQIVLMIFEIYTIIQLDFKIFDHIKSIIRDPIILYLYAVMCILSWFGLLIFPLVLSYEISRTLRLFVITSLIELFVLFMPMAFMFLAHAEQITEKKYQEELQKELKQYLEVNNKSKQYIFNNKYKKIIINALSTRVKKTAISINCQALEAFKTGMNECHYGADKYNIQLTQYTHYFMLEFENEIQSKLLILLFKLSI